MPRHTPQHPELLAPCGSLEAFFAASEAGADAVYCGLHQFSARAKAKNFTLQEVERMVTYQKNRDRHLYVTLNTLVKEREIPLLFDTLASLEQIGVDAVIIQDLAIWQLARTYFPNLEVHASTQMTIHNAAGAQQLQKMGFTRAVLARELTLEQIAAIHASCDIELEHFIHGALCFSFSGQCYFSSFLGGKSGNRGRCAQPCRRSYDHRDKSGYYFSANDLSAIDLLPRLAESGVMSLKIEGRMKSAEYVYQVVSAYRRALDARDAERHVAIAEAKESLRESFGRQPTRGFLTGDDPQDIATPSRKGSTGRMLGAIERVSGPRFSFRTTDRLHVGDRVRIQPGNDRPGTAFTLKELRANGKPSKVASKGVTVELTSPFPRPFEKGDLVFKVSASTAFTLSNEAARKRLSAEPPCKRPVELQVDLLDDSMHITVVTGGRESRFSYPVETFAAERAPLSADTLSEVFSRTDRAPYRLTRLTTGALPEVVIPPKRLKEIRRDLYEQLGHLPGTPKQAPSLQPPGDLVPSGEALLSVVGGGPRDLPLLHDRDIDRLILPLTPATLGSALDLRDPASRGKLMFDLPFIIFDAQWGDYQQMVQSGINGGLTAFRLNNLSHFNLFPEGFKGTLLAGYRLFSLNRYAIEAWRALGATEATLYIEDDRANLADICTPGTPLPVSLTTYLQVPLITSRIAIKAATKGDLQLRGERGDRYRVTKEGGLSKLASEQDVSLIGHDEALKAIGITRNIVDLSHLGGLSPKGKQVLAALKKRQVLAGTSTFNFYGELE